MTTILAAQAAQGGGLQMIIMMVVIFAIMYFTMILPQQKKQKAIRNFQNSITEGTEVVTAGGVHGVVKSVDLEAGTLKLKIADNTVIVIERSYVFASASSMPQK